MSAGVDARPVHVVPLARLAADERDRTMPTLTWITPNLCNDMHDCSVSTGDRFLAGLVPSLLRALGMPGWLPRPTTIPCSSRSRMCSG
jgi:hypothetical protein